MLKPVLIFMALGLAGCAAPEAAVEGREGLGAGAAGAAVSDRIMIHVANPEASSAFYRGAFGLAELGAQPRGERRLDLGGGRQLHIVRGRPASMSAGRAAHVTIRTHDIHPILAYLREHKISWQDYLGNEGSISSGRFDGVERILLRDPDGYWIEVNDSLKLK